MVQENTFSVSQKSFSSPPTYPHFFEARRQRGRAASEPLLFLERGLEMAKKDEQLM